MNSSIWCLSDIPTRKTTAGSWSPCLVSAPGARGEGAARSLTKGSRGLAGEWGVRRELLASSPSHRGGSWTETRTGTTREQGRSFLIKAGKQGRKSEGERKGVSTPPYLCSYCTSLLHVLPSTALMYCLAGPCHFSRYHLNVTYTMETSLTGKMSGLLCEPPGTPYLLWVILHCPHLLLCLNPILTGDTLRANMPRPWCPAPDPGPQQPRCLLSEQVGGSQENKV